MNRFGWVAVIILIVVALGVGAWVRLVKFEGGKPILQLLPEGRYLSPQLSLKVEDLKSGVAEARLEVIQRGKAVMLWEERFPKGTFRIEKNLALRPLPAGLQEGEAKIRLFARDYSWNKGNPTFLEKAVTIDTQSPQLSILGGPHYINRGGTGLVTYRTSEEILRSGILSGDLFFPGYAAGHNRYLCYFALPHNSPKDVNFAATAEDPAGNRTQIGFNPNIKSKSFAHDKIQLTDSFLKNILPYFTERDPNLKGSPVEIFLALNRKQREIDHQEIRKICQNTTSKPLWSGVFLRMPNSKPMASFGESRTYWYNGQQVDKQIHLGIDLASTFQSRVPAANSGVVVFAGPLGIYGQTVVIDHGCGLFSMYGHLSRIETPGKKEVQRGDTIGETGSTGMAGGDHLHFAMLVDGTFVDPLEWWDEHWIRDNIEIKMKLLEEPSA